jgi:hypothetical protein
MVFCYHLIKLRRWGQRTNVPLNWSQYHHTHGQTLCEHSWCHQGLCIVFNPFLPTTHKTFGEEIRKMALVRLTPPLQHAPQNLQNWQQCSPRNSHLNSHRPHFHNSIATMSSKPNIPVFLSEIALRSSGALKIDRAEESASDGFLYEDESLFSTRSVSDKVLRDIYGPNMDPVQSEEPTSPDQNNQKNQDFSTNFNHQSPPRTHEAEFDGERSQKGGPLVISYTTINWPISSVLILKLGENMLELYSYQHNYAL